MDQEIVVNRITRDLKSQGLIANDFTENVKFYIRLAWTCGWEYYRKYEINHNTQKVECFSATGIKLAEFNSIEDAARANKCNRDVIDKSIHGKTKLTKKKQYWKYAISQNESCPQI